MASWAAYQDMCFHVNTEENHRQAGRRLWNLFVSISVLKWLWYFIKFTATTHTKQSVLWLTTATWYDIVNWNRLSENDGEERMRIQKDQDTTSWRKAEAEKRRNLKNQSRKKEGWGRKKKKFEESKLKERRLRPKNRSKEETKKSQHESSWDRRQRKKKHKVLLFYRFLKNMMSRNVFQHKKYFKLNFKQIINSVLIIKHQLYVLIVSTLTVHCKCNISWVND